VSRIERLAARLQMSEAMVGLVVALAADGPEITSSITASTHGQTSIGAGVVLGSNVFNLAALLGVGALVAGRIHLHRRVVLLDGAAAVWVAAVSVLAVSTGLGAAWSLALVVAVMAPYVALSASRPAARPRLGRLQGAAAWLRQAVAEEGIELSEAVYTTARSRYDAVVAALALATVVGASAVMERAAETLGRRYDLSSLVVGGIVLAAVTSLPNAVGAVYLAARGRGAAVLSEAMNSNMLNVLGGLLLPGAFIGLGRPTGSDRLVAGWYAGLTVVSLAIAYRGRGLSRRPGVVIVVGYLAFLVVAAVA
jgi:cation:H+ antiporter